MKYLFIFLLFWCSVCQAGEVQTARGLRNINNGDVIRKNSMWEGQIKDLEDVTFIGWNFSRLIPHTIVFVNCKNLKFVDCNLNNVELQEDFIVQGCLTIHQETKQVGTEKHRIIECGDNKIRTYKVVDETIDIVERDFPTLSKVNKDKIRTKYEDEGIVTVYTDQQEKLINIGDTPDDKKIKAIRISPNSLNRISY